MVSVPVMVACSHNMQNIGFKGTNSVKLTDQWISTSLSGSGRIESEVSLCVEKDGKLQLTIKIAKPSVYDHQIESSIRQLVECISFKLFRNNQNPHYGTHYLDVDWHGIKIAEPERIAVSEALTIDMIQKKSLSLLSEELPNYHDFMHYYFEGLRANNLKSKYFHWFLVLEGIEHSNLYDNLFGKDMLFSEQDEGVIKSLARSMNSEMKKSALLALLRRTGKSRKVKLYEILENTGSLVAGLGVKDVGDIIDGRNRIFHRGSNLDKDLLFNKLYPSVSLVIEKLAQNPDLLD